jgi:hypothetical protein
MLFIKNLNGLKFLPCTSSWASFLAQSSAIMHPSSCWPFSLAQSKHGFLSRHASRWHRLTNLASATQKIMTQDNLKEPKNRGGLSAVQNMNFFLRSNQCTTNIRPAGQFRSVLSSFILFAFVFFPDRCAFRLILFLFFFATGGGTYMLNMTHIVSTVLRKIFKS